MLHGVVYIGEIRPSRILIFAASASASALLVSQRRLQNPAGRAGVRARLVVIERDAKRRGYRIQFMIFQRRPYASGHLDRTDITAPGTGSW